MTKYKNRIIGVIFLAILTLFLSFDVKADETTTESSISDGIIHDVEASISLKKTGGISAADQDQYGRTYSSEYRIEIAALEGTENLTVRVTLTHVNDVEVDKPITFGKSYTFWAKTISDDDDTKLKHLFVTLKVEIEDESGNKYTNEQFKLQTDEFGDSIENKISIENEMKINIDLANIIKTAVLSYENAISYVNQGTTTNKSEVFGEEAFSVISTTETKQDLKCAWNSTSATTKYYSKTAESVPVKASYNYNYAPGDPNNKSVEETVCKRQCTETVKVEYDPPVATKAGLCFQYKVKVTSFVECKATDIAPTPSQPIEYCTPSPECNHNGQTVVQAGPTEEFDSCIKLCDGGKYSSACSKKCYNEVYTNSKSRLALSYGNNNIIRLNSNIESESNKEYPLADCKNDNSDGCYYWDGDYIMWSPNVFNNAFTGENTHQQYSTNKQTLGRWYFEAGWQTDDLGKSCGKDKCYVASSNGIKYAIEDQINVCNDSCFWKTDVCKKGTYLNPDSITKDFERNLKEYNAALSKCVASATVTTKTATFKISLDYETDEQTKTIEFPYDSSNPSQSSGATLKTNTGAGDNDNTNDISNSSIILSYGGNYKDKKITNEYMAEWGFPGTYINNKTGEISFTSRGDGWYYDDNKFCMPLDADSVNTKWWEWSKIENTCYNDSEIQDDLVYNIKATATDFGYFGWNFNISCFYGLRNEKCNIDSSTKCCAVQDIDEQKESNGVSNYTFRTVSLDNLFPNAIKPGDVDLNKRPIGFNWTSKAKLDKNDKYKVDPEQLISSIQDGASSIYSNSSNLDYQFYLTPETLSKIKAYNENNKYTNWAGSVDVVNGINVYNSNLFRDVGSENHKNIIGNEDSTAIKKTGSPGINNENN